MEKLKEAKAPSIEPHTPTPAEKAALKKVKLNSFTVLPASVVPDSTVTATWNVTVPNDTGFDILIRLNGQDVANSGSKTFTVTQGTTFQLAAVIDDPPTALASRILKSDFVLVNTSDCQDQGFPASVITGQLKNTLDATFSPGANFSLKDGGSTVTAGSNGLVDIHVPLTIEVPDWFDADMDIHIQLNISGAQGHVFVTAPVVDPTASFSGLSDVLSGGCSDAVATGMTKMAYAFLEYIVDIKLRPTVEEQIENQVNQFTTQLQNSDPQHRTFAMTALLFSAGEGLLITACPHA
jgi:hypothetical protein